MTESAASPTIPDFVQAYIGMWDRFSATHAAALASFRDISSEERELHRGERFFTGVFARAASDLVAPAAIQIMVCNQIIRFAETYFAPKGSRLSLPHLDDHATPAAPLELWRQLQDAHGGGQGAELAHTQAASLLVKAFNLAGAQMSVKGGGVDLEWSCYAEEVFGQKGVRDLGYHARSELLKVMSALESFRAWAFDTCAPLPTPPDRYKPRDVFWCGGMRITMFTRSFTFRIPLDAASKLNEYVGLYGRAALDAAFEMQERRRAFG